VTQWGCFKRFDAIEEPETVSINGDVAENIEGTAQWRYFGQQADSPQADCSKRIGDKRDIRGCRRVGHGLDFCVAEGDFR